MPLRNQIQPFLRTYAWVIFYSLLSISTVLLAWQQYRWLRQVGESQLVSAQKEMALTITDVLNSLSRDLENELLAELNGQVTDPGLITQQWQLTYNQGWPELDDSDPRKIWVEHFSADHGRLPRGNFLRRFPQWQTQSVVVLMEQVSRENDVYTLHFFQLDMAHWLENRVLPLLQQELTDYQFQLTLLGHDYPVISQSVTRKPDLAVPVSTISFRPLRQTEDGFAFADFEPGPPKNPLQSAFASPGVFVLYETIKRAFDPLQQRVIDDEELVLNIFAKGTSLNSQTERQMWLSIFFGWAVLVLLVITGVILILGSRKLKLQQQREQEFVATVSHELRTPLTVIRSAADNLEAGIVSQPESVVRYGQEIAKQSQRLDRMIESTLYYSGLPSQNQITEQSVNARVYFNELFSPLMQLAQSSGIEVHTELTFDAEYMTTDLNGLRLIIENLFMNAILHGRPEEGPAQIWLSVKLSDHSLTLSLSDNGEGIPKEEQKKVFQPFVRGQRSTQQQHPGTGLGLNLITRMVSRLGGQLTLHSPYTTPLDTPQQGAQFNIHLPIDTQMKAEQADD